MSKIDDLADCIRLGKAGVRVMEAMRRGALAVVSARLEKRPVRVPDPDGRGRGSWTGLPPPMRASPGHYRLTINGRRFPMAGLEQLIRHGMVQPTRRGWAVRARFRLTGTPEHLRECLRRIFGADTPALLERQVQAGWKRFHTIWGLGEERGGPHLAIRKAMVLSGERLCARRRPIGQLVPRFDPRSRILKVGRARYRVGRGLNGPGVRWVWGHAEWWYLDVLKRRGVQEAAAKSAWSWWMSGYPHRALRVLEDSGRKLDACAARR